MRYAERSQRIDRGANNHGRGRGDAGFAGALHPEGVACGQVLLDTAVEVRCLCRAGKPVVEERAGEKLAGVGVVDHLLKQCFTDALHGPAMQLSLDDHWIDGSSDVVDAYVARHRQRAGLGVYLDLTGGDTIGVSM